MYTIITEGWIQVSPDGEGERPAADAYFAFMDSWPETKAWRSYVAFKQLTLIIDIFLANTDRLLSTLKALPTPEVFMSIAAEDKRAEQDRVMGEIMRLLFNFLASAQAVNDHLDKFGGRYVGKLGAEFSRELAERWRDLSVAHVIKRMRNLFLHQTIPPYTLTWSIDAVANTLDVAVTMNVDSLLGMKGWSVADKDWLEKMRHPGRLETVVQPYGEAARSFLTWMVAWHQEQAEPAVFEDVRRLYEQGAKLQKAMEDEREQSETGSVDPDSDAQP
ncbi:MAG: hypothetical protein M3P30_11185 [Chloroflexota bacterium]|nr:hypothetical protein [Chloroflexota bacterium]